MYNFAMDPLQRLKNDYPWIHTPLIVSAPMRLITLAESATEVSKAGGIGFLAAGTDSSTLSENLQNAKVLLRNNPLPSRDSTLPIGIGFINWGSDLAAALPLIQEYRPSAVWFFAPHSPAQLHQWTLETRKVSPHTRIWVQIGSVEQAIESVRVAAPDVLVVQGTDAGGHGLVRGASVVSLVPEVSDAVEAFVQSKRDKGRNVRKPVLLAAGGIMEARGAAAALVLGASGVCMGTRFLGSREAVITKGYQNEVIRASDGGQTTVRTKVYDEVRGTTGWADTYNGRGVLNKTYVDWEKGMEHAENKKLYDAEILKGDSGWGVDGRMTTYAGTGVGLVKEIMGAGDIVREVREGAVNVLRGTNIGVREGRL